MSLPWRLVTASAVAPVLVVGVAVLPGLASTDSGTEEAVTTSALLVSGRDDHGLVQSHVVRLAARADGTGDAGQLHDGTLVELLEVRDRAHRVRAGDQVGWLDDEQLRSRVHLVGPLPSCAPTVAGEVLPPGEQAQLIEVVGSGARVRLVRRPDVVAVVPASWLSEVAPRPSPGRCLPKEERTHDHGGLPPVG